MDYQERKSALRKTGQVLIVTIFAFTLGGYSVKFSGSGWAWTALIGCLAAGAFSLFLLIRDFWKPNA